MQNLSLYIRLMDKTDNQYQVIWPLSFISLPLKATTFLKRKLGNLPLLSFTFQRRRVEEVKERWYGASSFIISIWLIENNRIQINMASPNENSRAVVRSYEMKSKNDNCCSFDLRLVVCGSAVYERDTTRCYVRLWYLYRKCPDSVAVVLD